MRNIDRLMEKGFRNPFKVNGNWYRGNLHTHSDVSDGEFSPEEIGRWYKEHGYDFLSITLTISLFLARGLLDRSVVRGSVPLAFIRERKKIILL